ARVRGTRGGRTPNGSTLPSAPTDGTSSRPTTSSTGSRRSCTSGRSTSPASATGAPSPTARPSTSGASSDHPATSAPPRPPSGPRSAGRAGALRPVQRGPDPGKPLDSPVVPVGELVVTPPAPRGDQRPRQGAALADQVVVRARVMRGDLVGGMGDVELDRPAAARPEVDEQRAFPRADQVARMRLTVQELLAGALATDRAAQPAERGAQEFTVGTGQRRSPLPVVD